MVPRTMGSNKRCLICGKPGTVQVNGKAWLCSEHGLEATKASLATGTPVVWARRGTPEYLMVPTTIHRN